MGNLGLIPGLGRSPGEGKGYSLQYSDLDNFMNCVVHGVAKSWTVLSNFHFIAIKCLGLEPRFPLLSKPLILTLIFVTSHVKVVDYS